MQTTRTFALLALAGLFAASAQAQVTTSCTQPSGHHIYAEERACPLGGEKYSALQLGTHSTFGSNLDLSRISYLTFPIAVPVCPGNGFVDYKSDYTPAELETFGTVIASDSYKAMLGKETSLYLFARMIEMSGLPGFDQWWLDNMAATEAASCNLPADAYWRRALASSDIAISTAKASDENYWVLQLLGINQLRELGEFERASERVSGLSGIPEDWSIAFATLREAITRRVTGRVEIGHKFDQ